MKRRSYTKSQIAIWVISLLVVISMLCALASELLGPTGGGTSMAPRAFAALVLYEQSL
jgi:hypothetical protein